MDPSDIRVLVMDWDTEALPAGVEIDSFVFTIAASRQNGATALTKDQEAILAGSRTLQLRLDATGATKNDRYTVSARIVTNEVPAQTIERSFRVLVQER